MTIGIPGHVFLDFLAPHAKSEIEYVYHHPFFKFNGNLTILTKVFSTEICNNDMKFLQKLLDERLLFINNKEIHFVITPSYSIKEILKNSLFWKDVETEECGYKLTYAGLFIAYKMIKYSGS